MRRAILILVASASLLAIGACSSDNSATATNKKPGDDSVDFGDGSGTEVCNNGLDDDRNGLVDEGCVCEPGSTQVCCAVGAQKGGKQTCYLQNAKENALGSWGPCEGAGSGDCYGGDSNTGPSSGSGDNNSGSGPGSGSGDVNTGTGPGSGSGDVNTGSGSGDFSSGGSGPGSGSGDFNTGSGPGSGSGDFNTSGSGANGSGSGDFNTSGSGANGSGSGDFNTGSSGDFLTSGAGVGSGTGDFNTSGAGAGGPSGSGTGDYNTSGAGAGSSSSGGGDECVCAPGTWRWCDTPEACLWGVQICAPDFSWGKCNETGNVPVGCQPGVYDMGCCLNNPNACCENPFNHQSMGECTQQLDCN